MNSSTSDFGQAQQLTVEALELAKQQIEQAMKEPLPTELRVGTFAECVIKNNESIKYQSGKIAADHYTGAMGIACGGIPVFVDHTLAPNEWEFRDKDGNCLKRGCV